MARATTEAFQSHKIVHKLGVWNGVPGVSLLITHLTYTGCGREPCDESPLRENQCHESGALDYPNESERCVGGVQDMVVEVLDRLSVGEERLDCAVAGPYKWLAIFIAGAENDVIDLIEVLAA